MSCSAASPPSIFPLSVVLTSILTLEAKRLKQGSSNWSVPAVNELVVVGVPLLAIFAGILFKN